MLVPWLAPYLLNIEGTHVTGGLCVHFFVTTKQHEDTHLHIASTGFCIINVATQPLKQAEITCREKRNQNFTYFFRLDFSVVELLDIFSPVSAPELSRLSTRRPKTSQRRPALTAPKPVGRTLLTPTEPCPQNTQQDLEESRILEDIFFICWQRRKWEPSHLIFICLVFT